MEGRETVQENGLLAGIFHDVSRNFVRGQVMDTLCPYLVGLAHGYPDVGINDIGALGALFHILGKSDGGSGSLGVLFTLFYELLVREIFSGGAGHKVKTQFAADDHQRISHVVACVAHVYQLDAFQMAEMLTDGQHVRRHLGRMILVSQTIPYRHACVLCQALDDLLAVTAVLDTVIHSSENSCGVGNALFLSDLRAFGIQISRSHAEIMSGYLEGAAGSRTGLLKNQSHVFAQETLVYDALFFLCFQFSGKVDEVLDLFRCKIF